MSMRNLDTRTQVNIVAALAVELRRICADDGLATAAARDARESLFEAIDSMSAAPASSRAGLKRSKAIGRGYSPTIGTTGQSTCATPLH